MTTLREVGIAAAILLGSAAIGVLIALVVRLLRGARAGLTATRTSR